MIALPNKEMLFVFDSFSLSHTYTHTTLKATFKFNSEKWTSKQNALCDLIKIPETGQREDIFSLQEWTRKINTER